MGWGIPPVRNKTYERPGSIYIGMLMEGFLVSRNVYKSTVSIVTVCVRSTREGNVFTGVCPSTRVGWGGGTPAHWSLVSGL